MTACLHGSQEVHVGKLKKIIIYIPKTKQIGLYNKYVTETSNARQEDTFYIEQFIKPTGTK